MTQQKYISIALGVIVVAIGAFFAVNQPQQKKQPAAPPSGAVATSTANNPSSTYSLAVVATHKDQTSCWTVVNGSVYDVTPWISQHPGGESAILGMCGKDASSAFNDQHSGQRRPANELAAFKIGTLQ